MLKEKVSLKIWAGCLFVVGPGFVTMGPTFSDVLSWVRTVITIYLKSDLFERVYFSVTF